MIKFKKNSQI